MDIHSKFTELVSTLTPSERGYVKKFARATLSNEACQSIELLLQPGQAAAQAAEEQFDFILTSLAEYHKSHGSEIRRLINQIEILLFEKDLPEQAEKLIARALKALEKENRPELVFEIRDLESAALSIKSSSDSLYKRMQSSYEEMQQQMDEQDSRFFKQLEKAERK